jgi:hypothetical protein
MTSIIVDSSIVIQHLFLEVIHALYPTSKLARATHVLC